MNLSGADGYRQPGHVPQALILTMRLFIAYSICKFVLQRYLIASSDPFTMMLFYCIFVSRRNTQIKETLLERCQQVSTMRK